MAATRKIISKKPEGMKALPTERGQGLIAETEFNRATILLEQVEGMADLLWTHLTHQGCYDVANDNPAMTAFNTIKNQARAVDEILLAWYRVPGFIRKSEGGAHGE